MANLRVFDDVPLLARAAADLVAETARRTITRSGSFSLVLSGGSTPKKLYELLAAEPYHHSINWAKVEFFFGDERCVPPDHPDSNFKIASDALLSRLPIASQQVHRIQAEKNPAELAALEYGRLLKQRFGAIHLQDPRPSGPDLTLLGMGDDGHTASLFPYTPALDEMHHRCIAQFVEKSTTGRSWRVTLTPPMINSSKLIVVLVAGPSKAQRLKEVLLAPPDPQRLPIQLIHPAPGAQMIWLADASAAALLGNSGS